MNTLEGNKLIAEFRGDKKLNTVSIEEFKTLDETSKALQTGYFIEDLEYHTSWDLLMPIVNKIRSIYNGDGALITGNKLEDIISNLAEGCVEANILQVYNSVLEFIQWYNTQK